MNGPVVEIKDVWFAYNGLPVLQDVNLTVNQGDFLAVIGPNGGGKTTLMKLMLGLYQPIKGSVRIFGLPAGQASHRLGYVPQDVSIKTSFPVRVLDVVLMGRAKGGWWRHYTPEDRQAAREVLERVEMWGFHQRRMAELSGGQRQRVYVARALISEPELLLLDEPTASVDAKGQMDIYSFLKELNTKVTIVVVSHDMMALTSFARSVACVNHRLHFHDAPEITKDMLELGYQCPVELIAHGLPHRVLDKHGDH